MKRPSFTAPLRAAALPALTLALAQTGLLINPAAAQQAPAAPPPPAAPAPSPVPAPSMTGPLAMNPHPLKFDAGPLGTIYASGVLTGLGLVQSNSITGDRDGHFDISNGQAMLQKTDGMFQFYAQGGIYSLPAVGYSYTRASQLNSLTFGPLPVAYGKFAPTDNFSIQAGKLPTLIGAEYTFTFENMNIERGLLWFQEPAISRGVQVNYTVGPLALSGSFNDGYYSDVFNWLVGSAAYTINSSNTVSIVGGANVGRTTPRTTTDGIFTTPTAQNNGGILNLIYTYSSGPWTVTPYFQFDHVSKDLSLGIMKDASSYGGAILANYAFNDNFSLAGRAEIIGSTGSAADGSPNLLGYGPGSTAWSLTVTPTYQINRLFVRADASLVGISSFDKIAGLGFGKNGTEDTQARFIVEAGVLF